MKLNNKIWKSEEEFKSYYELFVTLPKKKLKFYDKPVSTHKWHSMYAIFKIHGNIYDSPIVKKKKKRKKKWKSKIDYKKYIVSFARKKKRLDYIKKALNTCECCKRILESKNLCLHHHCYWRLWKEKPIDLAVVCHTCHEKIHFEDWVKMPLTRKVLKARYDNITKKTYF